MKPAAILSREVLHAYEKVPDPYLILSPDLNILTASDAYLKAMRTRREALVGRPVSEAFPDNPAVPGAPAVKKLSASLQQVLATGKPHHMAPQPYGVPLPDHLGGGSEEKYWRPVNTPVLDEQGNIQYIIHQVQEVTELVQQDHQIRALEEQVERLSRQASASAYKQTQQALESKELLQAVIDTSPHSIAVFNTLYTPAGEVEDFEILMFNAFTLQTTGLSQADVIGKRYSRVFPHVFPSGVMDHFKRVASTGETADFEQWYEGEGMQHWFRFNANKLDHFLVVTTENITERKNAQKELQANQELLKATLDSSPDMIQVFRAVRDEKDRIVDFTWILNNHKATEINGEVTGKSLLRYNPGVMDAGIFSSFIKAIQTGEPQQYEQHYVHEQFDGWFHQSVVKLGDGVATTTADITARKKAELELKESKELLQSVFDSSPNSISVYKTIYNSAGEIVDFEILAANAFTLRTTGITPGQLIGKRLGQVFPHTLRTGVLQKFIEVATTGKPEDFERWYEGEGMHHWFRFIVTRSEDLLVVTTEDITERKKAEQELQRQYQVLKQAEEVAGMGSWEYDLASSEMTWSAGMYRLFGLPAGTPVSPETYLAHALAGDQLIAERIVHQLQQGRQLLEETLRISVQGQAVTLKIRAVVLHNQNGQRLKMLGVDLDITGVKRLEEENLELRLSQQKSLLLAILEAQEEEKRRIAEALHNGIGQILYATKLNLDRAALPGLQQRGPEPEALQTTKELLSEAIRETRRVSHDLVPLLLKDFGLEDAVQDLCSKYEGSSLYVSCQVEGLRQRLEGHLEVALYRISQELINNIVRHAGAVRAALELRRQQDHVLLQVRDNGKGFSYEESKNKGIGLRSIQDRVRLLNGSLAITKPRSGKGTLVTIHIPVSGR